MAAIVPTIITEVGPNLATKMFIYQFTKTSINDFLTCSDEFRVVDGAWAYVNNALESCTFATNIVTLTSATAGSGFVIVVGRN